MADDFSPRYVGDIHPALVHTFLDHNNKPIPLTGVVNTGMTLYLRQESTGTVRKGNGSWQITDVANAIAVYTFDPTDVAVEGLHTLQPGVPFPDGFQHFETYEIEWQNAIGP